MSKDFPQSFMQGSRVPSNLDHEAQIPNHTDTSGGCPCLDTGIKDLLDDPLRIPIQA